jgi:WD40 repeat protein
MALSPDARTLAVGLGDGSIDVLDATSGEQRRRLAGIRGAVGALSFLNAERLVAGDASGGLRIWDVTDGASPVARPDAHAGPVAAVGVVGTGGAARVVSAGSDGVVKIWRPDLSADTAHVDLGAPITDATADHDASVVLATTSSGEVIRWNPAGATTERIASIGTGARAVDLRTDSLAVARDDELLSTWTIGARSGSSPAWEQTASATGRSVTHLTPTTVISGDSAGQVRLWDVGSGGVIGLPLWVGGAPIRQVLAGADGTIWAVDVTGVVFRSDAAVLSAACAVLRPLLTGFGDTLVGQIEPICG